MDRDELERRLHALGVSVADRLTDEQADWFAEFLNVDEFALALECLADWLSEDDVPMSEGELGEATLLATAMGNADRVTGPLKLCPRPPG
jgi:hypothetical protein